jgi:hypothetical protein
MKMYIGMLNSFSQQKMVDSKRCICQFILILTNRLKSIWMQPKSNWALAYCKKEHLQPMIAENQIWQPQQKENAYPLPKNKTNSETFF